LNVTNLDRSRRFYEDVFGLEVAWESTDGDRRHAGLKDGNRLVLTLWQQSDGRFGAGVPGLHHLSFQVDSIEEVERAQERLRAIGVEVLHGGVVPHGEGADSGGIFFEDPDGIRLEIFTPRGAGGKPVPTPGAPTCGFF
jgi:catechol 2,3-dioxygenase-like lactoylglutathione lyase family enzyme